MKNAVAAELQAMMENLSGDVSWELRKRGFTDPNALRDFATYYGAITAEVPLEDDEPPRHKSRSCPGRRLPARPRILPTKRRTNT